MDRATFTRLLAASVGGVPLAAFARRLEGTVTTQQALFAALPRMRPGQWTRIILGSGAQYQKQIGAGVEHDAAGRPMLFLETQVGSPGGSCNPSSMRKAYLRAEHFGSLLDTYPLIANIGRTENMIYRFGDLGDHGAKPAADNSLRLLDEGFLYDSRPIRIVSVAPQAIHAASRDLTATHVVAEFTERPKNAKQRMRRLELWHDPNFPFGTVRYRATLAELEPFMLHVYSFGADFQSLLGLSLAKVRTMTPDGEYGQLPHGIGS
jgi:hypothetical protein